MKNRAIAIMAASAFAIAAIPVRAETPAEIEHYFDEVWKGPVKTVDACAAGRPLEFSDDCGREAEDLVCSVNAIYFALGESGLIGRYARQLAELTEVLADHKDYFNELEAEGKMTNPAQMSEQRMRSYCVRIMSTLRP